MAYKVLAELNLGYNVRLIEEDNGIYRVGYGLQPQQDFRTFEAAWEEFQACCNHCLRCESYLESDE